MSPLDMRVLMMLGIAPVAMADSELPTVVVQASAVSAYQPEAAVSATKMDLSLRDTPQTVNVVTQELIRDRNAQSMQDVLKNVPGVAFSLGDGQRDQTTIRGFRNISDNFVDGVRDDALYYRDLSNVERVEVIKGPASVLYGRGTAGGLVNRISKTPGERVREVSASVSDIGLLRGELDLGGEVLPGTLSLRLTGAVENSRTFRDRSQLKRQALAPSARIRLGERTSLLLQSEYLHDERVSDQGVPGYKGRPAASLSRHELFGSATAQQDSVNSFTVKGAGFKLDHAFNDQWSARNVFRYYDYQLDRNYATVASVNESSGDVKINKDRRTRDESGWFNQSELLHKTTLAGMPHQLLYGVETSQQDKGEVRYQKTNVATWNLFRFKPTALGDIPPGTKPYGDAIGRFRMLSAYLQDMVTLAPQWKLLVGARHDRFEQATHDNLKNTDISRVDSKVSPRAGLVWQPADALSFYASWSRAFQPSGETFALTTSNADLKPEQTENRELGSKIDLLGGKATLGLALFELVKSDVQGVSPVDLKTPLNFGEQRVRGAEISLGGEIAPGWELVAGYAYLDSEITSTAQTYKDRKGKTRSYEGNRLALAPRHSANGWLKHNLGHGFSVGAGVNYAGVRYASNTNNVKLDDYVTADAALYYRQPSYDLTLQLKNITDKEYFISAHSGADNYNMVGEPRTLELNGRYRF